MSLRGKRVTVVGAGVGGLAAAIALARRGAEVEILEQAESIRELGAGLQVSPNGAAVLRALGLGDALARVGVPAAAVVLLDGEEGRRVARLDLSMRGPDHGYVFVHRADLIGLLEQGARAAGVAVRLLQRVETVELAPEGAVLVTAQGTRIGPGLVVGGDGLHSVVRATLNGAAPPRFTGQVAWRAVIEAEPGAPAEAEVHMGPGRHLVSYPLRGGRLRNIVAVEERARWVEEGWSLRDDPLELRLAFAKFSPRVRRWLDQVGDCWLWGLFRHPVAARWGWAPEDAGGGGGLALLGDGAHPTLPFLAQGANMALEDAWVLAACLDAAGEGGLGPALAAYQTARRDRCARIVDAAATNARIYHLDGLRRDVVHLGMRVASRVAPALLLRRFDWLYGHDVTRTHP